jgi:hypothetical protein
MELRDLLAVGVLRNIEFKFTSPEVWQAAGDTGINKWSNASALFALLSQ